MEHKRIKVRLTKNSPYSDYGYYEKGDIGYIDGYVNDSAIIILENGKFAKSDLRWIEVVDEEDENVNSEPSETDDERIRKALIEYLRTLPNHFSHNGSLVTDWIAWLERQAQKTNPCDGCINRKGCINCENGELRETERKPTDNVEPKFKVGDWLQYRNAKPFFVEEITKQGYVNGDSCLPFNWENEIHLWTIQDAKDGDVLHCWIDGYEFILIFNCIKDGYVNAFCHLYNNLDSFSEEPTTMFCRTIQGHFTPATKEQCHLLFQKIKESGYEWDAEKKELKNVSQEYPLTPDECVKPNWSGEDEKIMQNLLSLWKEVMIEPTCCRFGLHKDEIVDWFKSLKDRVQLKQEWSEEDEDMCYKATAVMNRLCAEGKEYVWSINTLKKLFYWLKSLGHRSQWKPSDEQMKALDDFIYAKYPNIEKYGAAVKSLYQDLKKLREE